MPHRRTKKRSGSFKRKLLLFLLFLILGCCFGIWRYPTTARQCVRIVIEKVKPTRQNAPQEPPPEPTVAEPKVVPPEPTVSAPSVAQEPTVTIPSQPTPQQEVITVQTKYDHLKLGVPGKADTIIDRPGYSLGYVEYHEQPAWVVYRLTKQQALTKAAKRSDKFKEDPEIPTGSATLADYRRSGFDRGHLCPAADMAYSMRTMGDSFFMSNMSPQRPEFNRGVWKDLEAQVRDFAIAEHDIYVVTGPVLPKTKTVTIGSNKVTVPTHYYKVVYDRTPPEKMIGFILPNDGSDRPLQDFAVTVDAVEAATGLNFFSTVPQPKQEQLESTISVHDGDGRRGNKTGKTMPEVKVNLFADFQARAKNWARVNVSSGMKIWGVGKQHDKIEPWLQAHSFSATIENMRQRIVPRPRALFVSKKFTVPVEHKTDVETIFGMVRQGLDLTEYLGNNIHKLGASDSMLNFWGIVHFHVKPFSQRIAGNDDSLLFAYVTEDSFYAIAFGCHNDLNSTNLIKTLQSEFPESIEQYHVKAKSALDIDSSEYAVLCEKNINAVVSINGFNYYPPGGGMMTNGNSAQSCFEMIALHNRLDAASKVLEQGFLNGIQQLSTGGDKNIAACTIHLKLAGFKDDEILVKCPELGLMVSYRDKTGGMVVVASGLAVEDENNVATPKITAGAAEKCER